MSGVGNPSFPVLYVPVVAYRGARTYVHSTTLYTELMVAAGALGLALDGLIDMRFTRAITTMVEIHFDGEVESLEASAAPARFAVGDRDRIVFGRIIGTDEPVIDRKSYDESGIWDIARIDGRSVSLSSGAGYAPIEVVTSWRKQQDRRIGFRSDSPEHFKAIDLWQHHIQNDQIISSSLDRLADLGDVPLKMAI